MGKYLYLCQKGEGMDELANWIWGNVSEWNA
jgi:hypothetical protein